MITLTVNGVLTVEVAPVVISARRQRASIPTGKMKVELGLMNLRSAPLMKLVAVPVAGEATPVAALVPSVSALPSVSVPSTPAVNVTWLSTVSGAIKRAVGNVSGRVWLSTMFWTLSVTTGMLSGIEASTPPTVRVDVVPPLNTPPAVSVMPPVSVRFCAPMPTSDEPPIVSEPRPAVPPTDSGVPRVNTLLPPVRV